MTDDPAQRRRALADDLEQKNRWLLELSRRADANGFISPSASREAAAAAGIGRPKPPELDPDAVATKLGELADDDGRVSVAEAVSALGQATPTPPGEGGAVERGSPRSPGGALDRQIREAEVSGDLAEALRLKSVKLAQLPKP